MPATGSTAPEAGAPDEIEVTSAMIEAGVADLWNSGWYETCSPGDWIIVERIYRVMRRAAQANAIP
jgi:hypothetical protein